MDEDSILFQAMKNEMSPQLVPAAMRIIDPGSEYDLGVEIRTRNPMNRGGGGSVANPLRMQRQPSDFAGRPEHANANPAKARPDTPYGETYTRPSGNVITQQQSQWERDKFANMIEQARRAQEPSLNTAGGFLQKIREFFNANRKPDWFD